ncbi:hypothetical protein Rxycam_02006 [Rubrobacter xylanophilus DSM 9941]|uniref:helix-turn-helix transcriptional regulator n=1 Tax=Rubrobacter xylanophilus TaxID=49319 RepID=UPI001C6414F4|nr:helix-turn-helix transcriptional regulator [Rubrobacter xylanophilus]QYJ16175.1 hypothetical protein Rxycam_02006 [Rubrobacter xylanophilus DSM 9941]
MRALAEERAFSELKRLCCSGLDGPELLGRVVERLQLAVPFDAYCASTADPASGLVTRSLAGEMGGAEEAALFFERLYFEHDLEQLHAMARERTAVALLSESTDGRPERSQRYRELLGPLGLAHEARTVFAAGGYLWGSMDLIRARGTPDFSPREAAFLRRLAPHLAAGLRTAALRARSPAGRKGAGIPGVLALDGRGSVVRHTPAAEFLLRELEDLRPDWRGWEGLPPAVRMVVCALRRALASGDDDAAGPYVRASGRRGRWLTLYASLTEPEDGRPGETVVVIEPSKPEEVAWMSVAAYGLTPREEEITRLVARGLSTRQISRTLFISEHTVQNHLRNVFEKVGVHSRRELVKRLFFEGLYPSLFG